MRYLRILRGYLALSLCVAWACLCPTSATAQEKLTENTLKYDRQQPAAAATIEQFQWLRGYWVGKGLGGTCEETWLPALDGSMAGTFRLLQQDHLAFSEFFMLTRQEERWTLRLKHFHPTMQGWEEKDKFVEFPLIRVKGTEACFNGLTYRLQASGEMHVFLAFRQQDGTYREEKIVFRRQSITE